jgi:hypothetical protein
MCAVAVGGRKVDQLVGRGVIPIEQSSGGFSPVEINKIAKIVTEHKQELLEAWNDYFGRGD